MVHGSALRSSQLVACSVPSLRNSQDERVLLYTKRVPRCMFKGLKIHHVHICALCLLYEVCCMICIYNKLQLYIPNLLRLDYLVVVGKDRAPLEWTNTACPTMSSGLMHAQLAETTRSNRTNSLHISDRKGNESGMRCRITKMNRISFPRLRLLNSPEQLCCWQ